MKKRKATPLSTPATTTTGVSSNTTGRAAAASSIVSSFAVTHHEAKKRQERMQRFAVHRSINPPPPLPTSTTLGDTTTTDDADAAAEDVTGPYYDILGQNMEIEKSYLRLTTYPKCELVRPLPVLIKALEHVKRKYQQNEDFDWCHDQLKSIRQDITVQKSHIPANHTLRLDVYQTHARILLEHGQLSEFNQCLSNVLQIYDAWTTPTTTTDHIEHSSNAKSAILKAQGEFRAYSILYSLVQSKTTFLDLNMALRRRLEQIEFMLPSQKEEKRPKAQSTKFNYKKGKKRHRSSTVTATTTCDNVSGTDKNTIPSLGLLFHLLSVEEKHAWAVVRTMYDDGPKQPFFVLYDTAPCMSPYLMDFLLHRVRKSAYAVIVTAHRPSVSLRYLRESLHFDTTEEVYHFLQQRNTVFLPSSADGNGESKQSNDSSAAIEHLLVDCRQSHLILTQSRNP